MGFYAPPVVISAAHHFAYATISRSSLGIVARRRLAAYPKPYLLARINIHMKQRVELFWLGFLFHSIDALALAIQAASAELSDPAASVPNALTRFFHQALNCLRASLSYSTRCLSSYR
jgi:hypothetical protein